MNKSHLLLLSVLSGLIFTVSWPADGFPFLLFAAFVPLLYVERVVRLEPARFHRFSVMAYAYVAFFTWNLLTTWWIKNASVFGAAGAIFTNALLMAIAFQLFHYTAKKTNPRNGYAAFVLYWISFEYLHLDWDLTWTWLNLGNAFATYHACVQWYEFTGFLGGTLWVLLANGLLFNVVLKVSRSMDWRQIWKPALAFDMLVLVPVVVSLVMYYTYEEKPNPVSVVVVQPNVDPYHEKFVRGTAHLQVINMLRLAEEKVTDSTDFVVFPETAIAENLWENNLLSSRSLAAIWSFQEKHPRTKVVIGASTYKYYEPGSELSESARVFRGSTGHYDAYNTGIYLDASRRMQLYHKSKLVPGVEKMPFRQLMGFIENFAIDLGGTSGSLGTQSARTPFLTNVDSLKVCAPICYESVYGEFVGKFVRNGAGLIFIITNDGWWGNTPGYRQHFEYARLRAIETRRSIARSANTGISGYLNQRGDSFQETGWWVPAVLSDTVNINHEMTFYARFGDYIGRIALFVGVLLMLFSITKSVMRK